MTNEDIAVNSEKEEDQKEVEADNRETIRNNSSSEESKKTEAEVSNEPELQSLPSFSFSGALKALKDGQKLTRRGWNGKGQYVKIQVPDEDSKMTLPYIYIRTVQGDLVPWIASQTDVLAGDWVIA